MKYICLISIIVLLSCKSKHTELPNSLSDSEKIFGLSKFWQEVNYNFAYLDQAAVNWDSAYKAYIPKVIATKNDYEYYRELQRFCALLKDGHTSIFYPPSVSDLITANDFGEYRLTLKNIQNKAIVINTSYGKQNEIPIGSEIIEVNGTLTMQFIKSSAIPYLSGFPDCIRLDWGISHLLEGIKGEKVLIKYKTPVNEVRSLELVREKSSANWYAEMKPNRFMEFHWMDYKKGIAYVKIDNFSDTALLGHFRNHWSLLKSAKVLIVDIRENGGGSDEICGIIATHLMKSKEYVEPALTRKHIAYYKASGGRIQTKDTLNDTGKRDFYLCYNNRLWQDITHVRKNDMPDSSRLTYPIAILIGHHTFSAAEDFLVFLDKEKHIVKIGTNTFGSTGQPMQISMPGGGNARICTLKCTYSDGREFVGFGIKPDIKVEETVADFLNNNDPVINKAIEYLSQSIK